MLINELSKRTGFSRDTIRFYEEEGIINPSQTSRLANNYKDYSEDSVNRLAVVIELKDFGFSLKEITEILNLYELNSESCVSNLPMIESKIRLAEEKITKLTEMKKKLSHLAKNCNSNNYCTDCDLGHTLNRL